MIRRWVAAAAMVLVACTGAGASNRAGEPAASAPHEQSPPDAPPKRVLMQAGTEWLRGTLEAWCRDDACEDTAAAGPGRFVPSVEADLVTFMLVLPPEAVSVEVRRPQGRVVVREALVPADIMPFQVDLDEGRYVLALEASWGAARGRWLFGLAVRT
ncbi:MAG TPA: hypothetical protein VGB83_01490 [Actinomycetota bacterium]